MLHIAKSDIIEFNVVKWFCSGEYLIHTQKEEQQQQKNVNRMSLRTEDGLWKYHWIKVIEWQRSVASEYNISRLEFRRMANKIS